MVPSEAKKVSGLSFLFFFLILILQFFLLKKKASFEQNTYLEALSVNGGEKCSGNITEICQKTVIRLAY